MLTRAGSCSGDHLGRDPGSAWEWTILGRGVEAVRSGKRVGGEAVRPTPVTEAMIAVWKAGASVRPERFGDQDSAS